MACLSQEQLAQLALGLTADADLAAHLKECASCQAHGETMQSLVRQLSAAHAKFDCGHEEARERLLTLLPASRPSEPARIRDRISQWIGKLTTRQRIALGGIGVTAVLAISMVWLGSAATSLSAMEKMAENIRKAKSYECTEIIQVKKNFSEPEKPSVREYTHRRYWLAPGSVRYETTVTSPKIWKWPGPQETDIFPRGKPCIYIDHESKEFSRCPSGYDFSSTLDDLERLGKFSGNADRELGIKEINGKKARGFQIDMKKMAPNHSGPGMAEIWIDADSNLPVLVRYEGLKNQFNSSTVLITDMHWNIDLDPKLFDTTPPEGYTDTTPKPPNSDVQIRQIAESFRIYAETCGKHYPRHDMDLLGTTEELCKILGLAKWPTRRDWSTKEEETKAAKVAKAVKGFELITDIIDYNSDAAYYGTTVGPNDLDKVLLRWKLDDGQYKVIFGDLHDETISADKLRTLEEK